MIKNFQESVWGMLILIALGVLSIYGGPKSLLLLVPVAGLLWWSTEATPRGDRH